MEFMRVSVRLDKSTELMVLGIHHFINKIYGDLPPPPPQTNKEKMYQRIYSKEMT